MKGYLGIDVSKGHADFYLQDEKFNRLTDAYNLFDNAQGHELLREKLNDWFSQGMECLYVGVESTGGYENNWYYMLLSLSKTMPVKVVRLNPRVVKNSGNAAMVRSVTDRVSAEVISSYLIRYFDKVHFSNYTEEPLDKYREGRSMYSFIPMVREGFIY